MAKIIESCNKAIYILKALRSYRRIKVQNVGNRRIKRQLHSYEMSRCTKPSCKYRTLLFLVLERRDCEF